MRVENGNLSPALPQLTFDGYLHFAGGLDRFFVGIGSDLMGTREPTNVTQTIEPIFGQWLAPGNASTRLYHNRNERAARPVRRLGFRKAETRDGPYICAVMLNFTPAGS